jgi:hypothetical protein
MNPFVPSPSECNLARDGHGRNQTSKFRCSTGAVQRQLGRARNNKKHGPSKCWRPALFIALALGLCRRHKLGDVGIPWLDHLGINKIIKAAIGIDRLGRSSFSGCGIIAHLAGRLRLVAPHGHNFRPAASVGLSGE